MYPRVTFLDFPRSHMVDLYWRSICATPVLANSTPLARGEDLMTYDLNYLIKFTIL